MRKTMISRVLAGAATVTLAFGVAACAETDEADDSAGGAANETTSAVGEGDDTESTEGADDTESTDAAEGADGTESTGGTGGTDDEEAAGGETVEVQTADGNTVLVPGEFATELGEVEGEWGQPASVQESDGSFVAEFENGDRMIYSEETGPVPLLGMIGQTWSEEGGLGADVGLPVSSEEEVDGGWTQEFQNGQISWTFDGEQFSATVE